jgi:outer membrane biosynthesis protein TonB
LTAELFDPIPLDKMIDAERAVQTAASGIAPDVCARFETAAKLSDEDHKSIVEIARQALAPFKPKPEPKPEAKTEPKPEPKPEAKTEPKPEPKPEAKTEPKSEPGAKPAAPADVTDKPKPEVKEKS